MDVLERTWLNPNYFGLKIMSIPQTATQHGWCSGWLLGTRSNVSEKKPLRFTQSYSALEVEKKM